MSTLQTVNIKNASSSVNNIVLGTDGSVTSQGTIAMATPFSMRNKIINGAAEIYQRATGTITLTNSAQYFIDRWSATEDTDGTMTARQTSTAPSGFQNAMYFTTTLADASLGATQYAAVNQIIEGYSVTDLAWGTSSASPVTLSFWVRSSLTGTFGGSIRNGALNRSYPFTFSVSSANTFEYKTVTIPGDTAGTWATDNTAGLIVCFGLGVGSTYSGAAGSWASANYLSATGANSVIGTLSANLYLTGVQLEIGSTATPFERRFYNQEMALCQRYFMQFSGSAAANGFVGIGNGVVSSTSAAVFNINTPVPMRTTPTLSFSGSISVFDGSVPPTLASFGTTYISSPSTVWVSCNASASTLTIGRGAFLYSQNSTANYFRVDAEF